MNIEQNASIKSKENFDSELYRLEEDFAALKPELEITLKDVEEDVEGYLVVWNTEISKGGPLELDGKGCGKGGTRICPSVTLEEIRMLARSAALKNAAAGLPMGGAKTGLKADPLEEGFERKYRRFAQLCAPYLRENGGIWGGFGFDIGANPIHPHWICEELNSTTCFTGKPVDMGGTDYDNEGIAGLGVAVAAKVIMEHHKSSPKNSRFALQGCGAMGAAVLRYFSEYQGELAYLGDPKYGGTWYFESGISNELKGLLIEQNVDQASQLMVKEGVKISSDTQDVLYQDVDVLFPCAVQYVITKENAHKIQARFISEGANNPTTEEGYLELSNMGIHFVPDFIANPGGVIAAFVELTSKVTVEENAKTGAKVVEAKETTINRITSNVKELLRLTEDYKVHSHKAGLYLSLQKILGAR